MFRVSRSRRTDDPALRMILFAAGAVLGLAGIILDVGLLVTAGIVVLGIGMVVGIVQKRKAEDMD